VSTLEEDDAYFASLIKERDAEIDRSLERIELLRTEKKNIATNAAAHHEFKKSLVS